MATTAVTGCILILSMLVSVIAWLRMPAAGASPGTGSQETTGVELLDPEGEFEQHLRKFPLFTEGGILDDPQAPLESGLWDEMIAQEIMWDLGWPWAAVEAAEYPGDAYPPEFPYVYEDVEWWLDGYITPNTVRGREPEILDLTAALAYLAVARFDSKYEAGMAAYAILNKAVAYTDSCDLHLQLLWLVSMGFSVQADALDVTRQQTEGACGSQPELLWLTGMTKYRVAAEGFAIDYANSNSELVAAALADLELLTAEYPALGHIAQAEVLIDRSRYVEARGMRPFDARQWRAEALDHIIAARSLSSDPAMAVSHARVLRDLGRYDEALDILNSLAPSVQELESVVRVRAEILFNSGDFGEVVRLLETTDVEYPDHSQIATRLLAYQGYGRYQALATEWTDASASADVGGSDADDLAFLPTSRSGGMLRYACLAEVGKMALVADGRVEEADAWMPEGLEGHPPGCDFFYNPANHPSMHQDFLRFAGQWDEAAEVAMNWSRDEPDNPEPLQQAGEIALLRGDAKAAARLLEDARSLNEVAQISDGPDNEFGLPELIVLQLSAAYQDMGEVNKAEALLTSWLATEQDEWAVRPRFYAHSELGTLHLRQERFEEAAIHLSAAIEEEQRQRASEAEYGVTADMNDDPSSGAMLRGAQENNLSLALSRMGDFEGAVAAAEGALSRDSLNPIYLDTLAFAFHVGGEDPAGAVEHYRAALDRDATSYVSANNLAVILGQSGNVEEAEEILGRALEVNPDYAVAWHNLGALGLRSATSLMDSQSAFGVAGRADSAFRGRQAELLLDDTVYESGLDVSKTLAPDWTYGSSATEGTRGVLFSMIALLVVRAAWSLGLDRLVAPAMTWWSRRRGMGSGKSWTVAPTWLALLASVALLAWPAVRWAGSPATGALLLVATASLVVFPFALRKVLIPRGREVRHEGSYPVMAFGALATVIGLTVPPYPGISRNFRVPNWVIRIVPVTVACLAVVFMSLGILTAVPLARFLGTGAALLLAAILLPVAPFDGRHLTSRWVGLAASVGLGAATVAIALSWI